MNLFSVNQVNQVYVVSGQMRTPAEGVKPAAALVDTGDVVIGHTKDGKHYFVHKGIGGITRSDVIENVMWGSYAPAAAMAKSLKSVAVKLNSAFLDESGKVAPVGQDFLLRLEFTGYIGVSPEDSKYWKYGVVHVLANMTESEFYKKMAISLVKNMSREAVKFIKIALIVEGSTPVEVTMNNINSLSGEYAGIVLSEVEPDWIRGLKQQKVMSFEAIPTTVAVLNDNGTYDDLVWGDTWASDGKKATGGGTVADVTIDMSGVPATNGDIVNSKLAADYEYFFHGERGDQYRMVGWPDYIPTEYMVNPSNEYGYDFIQIHYAYIGANEGCQKSEKDITFLFPRTTSGRHIPGAAWTKDNLDTKAKAFANSLEQTFAIELMPHD